MTEALMAAAGPEQTLGTSLPHYSNALHPALSDSEMQNHASAAERFANAFAHAVFVLMKSKDYKSLAISNLHGLLWPALSTGQFAILKSQSKSTGIVVPVAFVSWAKLSEEDDRLFSQQAEADRASPKNWSSGDIVWLVDAAGDPKMLAALIARLRGDQLKGHTIKYHARADGDRREVRTIEIEGERL
ncbi:toxin-activating lysine-acyltransferase [Hyphomicrobium sp. DY-1]|uniref:toxin-activating lysine-acyltransferase n=1 Tax=Hyphomicrobium sp. DY-1 TaxID=3075650 RepID=UPI0039C03CCA